uniref:Uncharacterized protein n=1 Tax=Cacopsylla melanoneura TaxID=428564 RepID=A0A8D8TR31_9HEMI
MPVASSVFSSILPATVSIASTTDVVFASPFLVCSSTSSIVVTLPSMSCCLVVGSITSISIMAGFPLTTVAFIFPARLIVVILFFIRLTTILFVTISFVIVISILFIASFSIAATVSFITSLLSLLSFCNSRLVFQSLLFESPDVFGHLLI